MSAPIPDKFARTARLLVKIDKGVCTLAHGQPLPEMKSGIIAELVISPWDVIDDAAREELLNENRIEFLAKSTSIWARVKRDAIPPQLTRHYQNKIVWPKTDGVFIEIQLLSLVSLIVRGDGRAALGECNCSIPALPQLKCNSLNEAYTRISEAFEPSRRSHTGNIFNCVFFERGNCLYPLRELRDELVAAPQPSNKTL